MCIFCKIAKKDVEALVIYEDERVMAFLDIRPLSKGHTLIIPKEHYESLLDVPEDLMGDILKVIKVVCEKLKRLGAKGFNIVTNIGEVAGQEVMHAHIHVIPRYSKEEKPITFGKPIECDLREVHELL